VSPHPEPAPWWPRALQALSAAAGGLFAAAATPSSAGGSVRPALLGAAVALALLAPRRPRAWHALAAWALAAAGAAASAAVPFPVAVRLCACGAAAAGLVAALALAARRPVRAAALGMTGASVLVVDAALGLRLSAEGEGPFALTAAAALVRVLLLGAAAFLAFRRAGAVEDGALETIAEYLAGRDRLPARAALPEEVRALAEAAEAVKARLGRERDRAHDTRRRLADVAARLRRESDLLQAGAADQVGSLSETSATAEQLMRSTGTVSDRVRQVAVVAEASLSSAQGGLGTARAFNETIGTLRDACSSVADHVIALRGTVQRIAGHLDAIFRATSKADVLALSAELEASKATGGEDLRFFTVADQMREMGEAVTRSMAEIGPLLEEIRQAVRATARATDLGVSATARGFGLSSLLAERLSTIADLSAVTVEAVKEVSVMTDRQMKEAAELERALSRLSGATQARTSAAAPMVASGRILESLASAAR
jgi:methyl-accepting chemotaxis protein